MKLAYILLAPLTGPRALGQFATPVKEQYDHMTHKQPHGAYSGVISYIVDNSNPWSGYRYGEQVGYFLEGYLRMYETTKDKAYLIRFINLSLTAMAWRNSDFYFTGESVGDDEVPYMNGVLLWPMAHFVHLILAENNDLAGQVIPNGLIAYQGSTVPVNVLPFNSNHTYASIAAWFTTRCVETMDAVLAVHWSDESGFCHGERICAVNLQAGFTAALLYFGHLGNVNSMYSGLLSYLDKAAIIASMFSGDEPDDRCRCIEGEIVLIPFANNSFWWHHNALRYKRGNCFYVCWGNMGLAVQEVDLTNHHEFVEDISHGVIDLAIPTLSNRFGLYTNGAYPFLEADLVRFRNAFTKHIAQWDGMGWQFKNGVDGANGPVSSCNGCSPYPPLSTFKYAALGWMPLHAFDSSPGAASGPGVYEIVSQFYSAEVFSSPTAVSGGLYHYGVAEVVSAQWEHECFDLTLFNRELPYDQDFAARHNLTIDPSGEAGMSFADPRIPDARFTVLPGVRSTHRAGGAVIWEPGFEASYESVVEAVIDPLGCDMTYRSQSAAPSDLFTVAHLPPDTILRTRPAMIGGIEVEPVPGSQLLIVPNPSNGRSFAHIILGEATTGTLHLIDATGRRIWQRELGTLTAGEHRIELPPLSSGIYHCRIDLPTSGMAERIVVQ